MWFWDQLKPNLVGFISTVIRTSANLVATTGCYGNMVTMATVNSDSDLFFTLKKELRLNVMNYLFESKFFSLNLKFYEKLVTIATRKMPIIPLSKNVIS